MTLRDLFQNEAYPDIDIESIMYDSRQVLDRAIFFCIRGIENDGHQFINQAIDNGAICIVHSRRLSNKKEGIIYLYEEDLDRVFVETVHRFFDYPSRKLHLIGVTGTNGKTTIAELLYQLASVKGKAGYSGTLGTYYDQPKINMTDMTRHILTTKDLVTNDKDMDTMVKEGVFLLAMEVSSQGLEMNRVAGIDFETAIFTNLTQDHLDYHLDMESYYQAKKKLFQQVIPGHSIVVNIDDPYGARLAKESVNPVISVSRKDPTASCYYQIKHYSEKGIDFTLTFQNKTYRASTSLLGDYNICNYVEALMALVLVGFDLQDLLEWGQHFQQIPGRNQVITAGNGLRIVVDYAHTPASMAAIMSYYRSQLKPGGHLISVFGAPGKRDKSKRPLMGEVSDQYCDTIYLTEDDSRDEIVGAISDEIAGGILKNPYVKIDSRPEAIYQAIITAKPDDIVLILGKGSETLMARSTDETYPGDVSLVSDIVKDLEGEKYDEDKSTN